MSTPWRRLAWLYVAVLLAVVPMAVNEVGWNREWLTLFPSRRWVYAAVMSALATIAWISRVER